MWLYVPEASIAGISNVILFLCPTSSCSGAYLASQWDGVTLHRGWNYLVKGKASFTVAGAATWTDPIVKMRVRLTRASGAPVVYVDQISHGALRRPKVILTFDDSWESQYTEAFAYMQTKSMKGVVYNVAELVGTDGFMTLAQLKEMYEAGWDIAVHGEATLPSLADLAAQKAEIAAQRQYLLDNGMIRAANHYAYPGGQYNDDSLTALAHLGFLTARTTKNRVQAHSVLDERYVLSRYGVNIYPLATVKGWVDQAVAAGGAVLLNFHRIVATPDASGMEWSTANFRGLIDYIATLRDAGTLDVVTVSEWYRGLYQ